MSRTAGLCAGFALFGCSCAHLQGLASEAERARKEAAALVIALDGYLEQCADTEPPRPRGCEEAARLRVQLEPYVGMVEE
jgi:hypothetical protein